MNQSPQAKPMKAVAYARTSSANHDAWDLDAQLSRIRQHATNHSFIISEEYREEGVGSSDRVGLERLLHDVQTGAGIDAVYVASLDRLRASPGNVWIIC